jgi:hypothetical protein
MNKEKYQFDDLLTIMPDGWKEKAREFKAFTRTRKLKTVVDLLQLVFLFAGGLISRPLGRFRSCNA